MKSRIGSLFRFCNVAGVVAFAVVSLTVSTSVGAASEAFSESTALQLSFGQPGHNTTRWLPSHRKQVQDLLSRFGRNPDKALGSWESPHHETVLTPEQAVSALRELWRETMQLHELYPLTFIRMPFDGIDDVEGDWESFAREFDRLSLRFGEILAGLAGEETDTEVIVWVLLNSVHDPEDLAFTEELFQARVNQSFRVGGILSVAFLLPDPRVFFGYDLNWASTSLLDILSQIPAEPEGVTWDGEAGYFDYDDWQLQRSVTHLAAEVLKNPAAFQEELLNAPDELQARLRRNSDGSDPAARIEPFDLLKGALVENIRQFTYGEENNWIVLAKPVHRLLHTILDLDTSLDPIGAEFSDVWGQRSTDPEGRLLSLKCSSHWKALPNRNLSLNDRNTLSLIGTAAFNVVEMIDNETYEVVYGCHDRMYDVRLLAQEAEPMSLPPEYDLPFFANGREAEILVSFSLTTEVTQQVVNFLQQYLRLNGLKKSGDAEIVPTRQTFLNRLRTADMLIPVAHSLDVNSFHVGTETSKKLEFTRSFQTESGERQQSRVTILFPNLLPDEDPYVEIDRESLAAGLQERRRHREDSLFVLHTSCFGERNLMSWTLAFRRALELDREAGNLGAIEEATDVPLVYAFKGGFPTSSPLSILTSMLHPLNGIELVSQGANGHEVLRALDGPAPEDLVYRALKLAAKLFPNLEMPENIGYEPVLNIDFPALLENSSYAFEVHDRLGEEPVRRY